MARVEFAPDRPGARRFLALHSGALIRPQDPVLPWGTRALRFSPRGGNSGQLPRPPVPWESGQRLFLVLTTESGVRW